MTGAALLSMVLAGCSGAGGGGVSSRSGTIVFTSYRDDETTLYRMNLHGSGQRRFINGPPVTATAPSFSPDGKRLVGISYSATPLPSGGYAQLSLFKADGTVLSTLSVEKRFLDEPALTADGQGIIFVAESGARDQLFRINIDGTGLTQLTHDQDDKRNPTVSRQGKIAFVAEKSSNLDIYVMNTDGSGLTQLTHGNGSDLNPAFSPDGRRIVFVHGNEIWIVNADGTAQKRVIASDGAPVLSEPVFTRDGRRIVYVSTTEVSNFAAAKAKRLSPRDQPATESAIFIANVDGSNQQRLTQAGASNVEPTIGGS